MKFDMQTPIDPAPAGPGTGGGDGNFDVDPPVIASILSTVNAEAQAYNSFARTLAVATQGICEAANAWPVAAEMDSVNTFVLQRYVRIIGARTGQNIGAVTDVVNILVAADQQMSDTARSSAAQAAQAAIDDDPLADRNAPVRVGPGPGAVQ